MIGFNAGGNFALGGSGGTSPTGSLPQGAPLPAAPQQQSTGVTGFIKNLVGGIDWSGIFGQSKHEKEHIATISGLYERAVQGDAAAYADLHHRMTAKWQGDPNKWLRPQHERDLARRALDNLASNTQFVTAVAQNPLYSEIKKTAQEIRDDLATAIGRIGAGVTQTVVDKVGGPNGSATGGAVIPFSRTQLLVVAAVGGVLLVLALRKKG